MLVKEFRVMLPLTVEEYHLAQLYGVAEVSKRETGGGEGVEVVKNEPFRGHALLGGKFTEGQYTYKIYHLKKKVPAFVRLLAPEGALEVHEESWNAYPYSKTVYSNPGYMKKDFVISIESMHLGDRGTSENVDPVMTCYKLVTCAFKWFGLQTRIEKYIQDFEQRLFTVFHRQIFCWIDQWYGLTMDDIRQLEDRTQEELGQQITEGPVRGTMG